MEPQEGLVDEDKTWVWPPEERLMGLLENIDPRQGSLLTCFAKKDLPILVHPNDLDYTVACHCCIYAVMPDSSFKAMVMVRQLGQNEVLSCFFSCENLWYFLTDLVSLCICPSPRCT